MSSEHPHQNQSVEHIGPPLHEASTAMVLVHGRGASAKGILDLAHLFPKAGMAYFAPQAANNSWYPYRFIAPIEQNEPFLSSALATINALVKRLQDAGVPSDCIVLGGFSQGACLICEYAARNPMRFGGLLAFSGGLIGPLGQLPAYAGSLDGTPVLIGCSDIDPHIPLERVNETAEIFERMGAEVSKNIYKGMGHTINSEEIKEAQLITTALQPA